MQLTEMKEGKNPEQERDTNDDAVGAEILRLASPLDPDDDEEGT